MFKSKQKTMSAEEIKALSEKLSKEISTKLAENLTEDAKEFSDESGKISQMGQMALVIKHCNKFTTEYVTQMLTKVFEEK